jgi:hypothetical protein
VVAVDTIQRHEWVEQYNWDDGLDPIRELVNSSQTEFATALLIYWRLEGPWLVSHPSSVNEPARVLNELVRDRLLAGFYPKGKLRFEPTAELSRTQVYKLQTFGMPRELLQPEWAE